MESKEIALGFLLNPRLQDQLKTFESRFLDLPIQWLDFTSLKGFFFPFWKEGYPEGVLKTVEQSLNQAPLPLDLPLFESSVSPSFFSPKYLVLKTHLPQELLNWIKDLAHALKKPYIFSEGILEIKLAKLGSKSLKMAHLESMEGSLLPSGRLNNLVFFERKKNGLSVFYEFDLEAEKNEKSKKPNKKNSSTLLPKSFLPFKGN